MSVGVVRLTDRPASGAGVLHELCVRALDARDDHDPVDAALRLAYEVGPRLPTPGSGDTLTLWEALASLGAADLTVARVVEPHLDALAILQAVPDGGPRAPDTATFGVYAAEGPGARLEATGTEDHVTLSGGKPWCSLADQVSHALVTAWVDSERRGLFLVDLGAEGVRPDPEAAPWVAHGLSRVTSGGLLLHEVPAVPVGPPGWYLERPGFAWGGIGVAAAWFGGAVGVARRVHAGLRRREPDQVALMHLGVLDTALHAARLALVDAAALVDSGAASGTVGARACLRVRQVVADTVETVLRTADHALGPAPLALEEEHVRRVSDLRVYVRQHHAERDSAALGRSVLETTGEGWCWW